ncbi:hypothetical protein M407DRAFT_86507, partial [Tulasnella calospora MUT 4182]
DTQWNTDTGATSCMTPHRHWIQDMAPCCIPVCIATDEVVYALGKGSVLFQPVVGGIKLCPVLFSRVLYVPDINNNLFAVISLAQKRDVTTQFSKNGVSFTQDGKQFMTATYYNKAAFLDGHTIPASG